jgi:glutamate-1-semialdehyde 2,1-aminomutase
MPSLVVSYSHGDDDIDQTVEAIDGALAIYRRALDHGVERYLVGRPSQTVYRAYNLPDVTSQVRDHGDGGDGALAAAAQRRLSA